MYGLDLAVGHDRVLRLMRDNHLLSPYRRPPRPANDHDGTILTAAPDVLWGTDATMVQTAADGRVWIFAALDHWKPAVIGALAMQALPLPRPTGVTVYGDRARRIS